MVYSSRLIHAVTLIVLLASNALPIAARASVTSNKGLAQQVLTPPSGDHDIADTVNTLDEANITSARPFYNIAHRVLTEKGVHHALSNGANAVEIDMYAWKKGWWADHDGTPTSAGDTARAMFETIATERKAGKPIIFVWLDIKNADWCSPNDPKWRHCSIAGLRDLAREVLQPHGVRVLYGFYRSSGLAYSLIRDNLNDNEAINLNGKASDVATAFKNAGPAQLSKRVMSYGYFNLPFEFGDCKEKGYYTCTELRQAVETGAFGKVFGWTSSSHQAEYVDKLLGVAGIDGLIHGLKATNYGADQGTTRAAAQDIINWVKSHSDRRYIATVNDVPW